MTQEGTYGMKKKLTSQNIPKNNNQMSKNQIIKEAIISAAHRTPKIQMSSSLDEEEEVLGSEYKLGNSDSDSDEDSSGVESSSYEGNYKSIE